MARFNSLKELRNAIQNNLIDRNRVQCVLIQDTINVTLFPFLTVVQNPVDEDKEETEILWDAGRLNENIMSEILGLQEESSYFYGDYYQEGENIDIGLEDGKTYVVRISMKLFDETISSREDDVVKSEILAPDGIWEEYYLFKSGISNFRLSP